MNGKNSHPLEPNPLQRHHREVEAITAEIFMPMGLEWDVQHAHTGVMVRRYLGIPGG